MLFFKKTNQMKNCFYFAGHSFGGATTLLGLSEDPRFKVGIVLDGWLFPIKDEDIVKSVNQPVLFVNTGSHYFFKTQQLAKLVFY
jgi:hypothetical protein